MAESDWVDEVQKKANDSHPQVGNALGVHVNGLLKGRLQQQQLRGPELATIANALLSTMATSHDSKASDT